MEVEAVSETRRVFAGSRVSFVVDFEPLSQDEAEQDAQVLLSGYAVVQGFFKLGETLSTEPFQETRKAGIVLGRRGFEYGQPLKSSGFLQGVLGGLRHLVINAADGTAQNAQQNQANTSVVNGNQANLDLEADEGHDYPIFATSQLLLFTDLKLDKTSLNQRRFRIAVDLPRHLPPTYRSRSLQITYTLVIGFQRPVRDGKPVETRLFLPFRVLAPAPTPAIPQPFVYDLRYPENAPPPILLNSTDTGSEFPSSEGSIYCNKNENESEEPENTKDSETEAVHDFAESGSGNEEGEGSMHATVHIDVKPESSLTQSELEHKKQQAADENMDAFIDKLLAGTTPEQPSSPGQQPDMQYSKVNYALSRSGSSIASVVLAKPAVSIGDVIAAQVKLHRPCLHLSAYLELQETIAAPYSASTAGNYSGVTQEDAEAEKTVISTTYARRFQSVYGLQELALYFPTLTSTTPRLDTEQLTASWVLHLEFVGLTGSALAETEDDEECLEAKGQVDYEMFSCKIPLVILPPSGMGHTVAKVWKFQ